MKGKIAIAGVLAMVSASTASANGSTQCITDPEMHALVAYVLPSVIAKAGNICGPQLAAGSYFNTALPQLHSRLDQGKDAAWPMAKSAFFKFSSEKDARTMGVLPDRSLRPLLDDIITEKLALKIDGSTCASANDIAEALAPLSPEQTVHLVATILITVARKDHKLPSCPREAG
jgi:hypothetical protein